MTQETMFNALVQVPWGAVIVVLVIYGLRGLRAIGADFTSYMVKRDALFSETMKSLVDESRNHARQLDQQYAAAIDRNTEVLGEVRGLLLLLKNGYVRKSDTQPM